MADALRRAEKIGLLAEVGPGEGHLGDPGAPGSTAATTNGTTRAVTRHRGAPGYGGWPLTRGIAVAHRRNRGPRFVPTPLGRLVVEALPDKREVGALRGLPGAAALYRSSARLVDWPQARHIAGDSCSPEEADGWQHPMRTRTHVRVEA